MSILDNARNRLSSRFKKSTDTKFPDLQLPGQDAGVDPDRDEKDAEIYDALAEILGDKPGDSNTGGAIEQQQRSNNNLKDIGKQILASQRRPDQGTFDAGVYDYSNELGQISDMYKQGSDFRGTGLGHWMENTFEGGLSPQNFTGGGDMGAGMDLGGGEMVGIADYNRGGTVYHRVMVEDTQTLEVLIQYPRDAHPRRVW